MDKNLNISLKESNQMETKKNVVQNIDEYISAFPKEIQDILENLRRVIKDAVPKTEERISYKMPAFALKGKVLVYFAVHKNHIGFYPTPNGIEAFKEELKGYKSSKGAVQFPIDKPIPYDLISKIAKFRANEVLV